MTTVITCATSKGGGGKTTVELVLAAEAARAGHRVLLVDLDRNQSLTTHFGVATPANEGAGYRLVKDLPLDDAIVEWRSRGERLDVIPMGVGFRSGYLDRALENEVSMVGLRATDAAAERIRLTRLDKHLGPLKKQYDYVFLDIPNDDADVALNGLYAADVVLAPATPDPRDVELAMAALRHVARIRRDHKPALAFGGFVANRVDRALLRHQVRQTRSFLHPSLRPLLLDATLRRANAALADAWSERTPPSLVARARAGGGRDGVTFADDCSRLFEAVEARVAELRGSSAEARLLRAAFDEFVADATARDWQNLGRAADAPRGARAVAGVA